MGIDRAVASLLLELKSKVEFDGAIVELGKQDILLNRDSLKFLGDKFGFPFLSNSSKITDICFFKWLGFSSVRSLDYSPYEGADLLLDLNKEAPLKLHELANVIYDGGTLEHVFNLPQALKNIHSMLKIGGSVIHVLPSHNHVDHGFYMFSPMALYQWYEANGYRIIESYVMEYSQNTKAKWKIYEYKPGCIDQLSFGGWGKEMLGIWLVAEKKHDSTCGVMPQQGSYLRDWGVDFAIKNDSNENAESYIYTWNWKKNTLSKIKSLLKSFPFIFENLKEIYYWMGINYLVHGKKKPKIKWRY